MNFLIVTDREYKKTSRGIDVITTYFAERGHTVDHAVFFRRKKYEEKQITKNIRQLYFYDPVKIYRGKLQFIFPGFILRIYFRNIIQRSSINFENYDYIVLESGHPMYLASEVNTKIIYRQSDPIFVSFNSNRSFYQKLELEVIKKSIIVSSALNGMYFPQDFKYKIHYWHSGFIPYNKDSEQISDNSIAVISDRINWSLLNKITKKYPALRFNIIGNSKKIIKRDNITYKGYLDYNSYLKNISLASLVFIPYSKHFSYQLRQTRYTAKILVSMNMGLPILICAYGLLKKSEVDKKLFVYNSHDEALVLFDDIVLKIKNSIINRSISESTRDFLLPQIVENRIKQLDDFFNPILDSEKTLNEMI